MVVNVALIVVILSYLEQVNLCSCDGWPPSESRYSQHSMKSLRVGLSGIVQSKVTYAPVLSVVPQDSGILGGLKVPEVPLTFNKSVLG